MVVFDTTMLSLQLDPPFRSRRAICLWRLCRDPARARHPAEHEPGRQSLRQRQGGSFMKTLKQEEVDGSDYRDAADARARIGDFIEAVYNRQRLHSALDYRPPAEYEELLPRLKAAISPH